jgi:hypothetical protein
MYIHSDLHTEEVQDDHTGRLGKPFVSSDSGWSIQPGHGKALPGTRMIAFSLSFDTKRGGMERKKKKEGSPADREGDHDALFPDKSRNPNRFLSLQ